MSGTRPVEKRERGFTIGDDTCGFHQSTSISCQSEKLGVLFCVRAASAAGLFRSQENIFETSRPVAGEESQDRQGKNAVAFQIFEEELPITGIAEGFLEKAPGDDEPGFPNLFPDFTEAGDFQSGSLQHRPQFVPVGQSGESAFVADGFQKETQLPGTGCRSGRPIGQCESASGLEQSRGFAKKSRFVGNVGKAFNGDDGIAGIGRQGVFHPVPAKEGRLWSAVRDGLRKLRGCLLLSGGHGPPRDDRPPLAGETTRCRAIAATDVANPVSFGDGREIGNFLFEGCNRDRSGLVSFAPVSVVQIVTPDVAVELVQRIVVLCNLLGTGGVSWKDHGFPFVSPDILTAPPLPGKGHGRNAPNARLGDKQPPGIFLLDVREFSRGDKERPEIRAAEGAGGWTRDWQFDTVKDISGLRIKADHGASAAKGDPDVVLLIDRHAVG